MELNRRQFIVPHQQNGGVVEFAISRVEDHEIAALLRS
jgi:hypothetical protein